MLTTQVLCTNAFYKQLIDDRKMNIPFNNLVNEIDMLKNVESFN